MATQRVPDDLLPDNLRLGEPVPADLLPEGLQQQAVPIDMLPENLRPAAPPVPVEPEEPDATFGESLADIGLGVQRGTLTIIDAAIDAFGGAGSDTSKFIKRADQHLAALLSAEGQADAERAAQIIADAEGKGLGTELKAGLQAVAADPSGIISQAAGSAIPFIATSLLGTPALIGLGAVTGAGIVKGGIYDIVESELVKEGIDPERAKAAAEQAQAYGGQNIDQILLGTLLGAGAAVGPLERVLVNRLSGNIASRIAKGAVTEAIPEAVQAGQERFAQNIALQREGFDVDLGRGVAAQASMEGFAAAPLGGIAGVPRQPAPPTPTPTPAPGVTELPETDSEEQRAFDPDRFEAAYRQYQAQGMSDEQAVIAAGRVASGLAQDQTLPAMEIADVGEPDVRGVEPSVTAPDETVSVEEPTVEPAGVEPARVDGVSEPVDAVSVGAEPIDAALTPASEQTVAQRLDSLNVPKGAAIRKRLKDVDISTSEGFAQLDEELRKYVANPRANEAAKARIDEYLAAGEEATGPLAAMVEQLAVEPAPEIGAVEEAVTPEVAPEVAPEVEPEVDQAAADEGSKMIERYNQARAEGATEAEAAAVAQTVEPEEELPPSLVESILQQLQSRRETLGEEEFVGEANRGYNLALRLEEKYGGTDLVRLRDLAQEKIATGTDVVEAYTQAEQELDTAPQLTPEEATEAQRVSQENKGLRQELNTLGSEIGIDTTVEAILEPKLNGVSETDKLRIARQTAQLARDNPEYNFYFPTQSIQKAFDDPAVQAEVEAARQRTKETRQVEREVAEDTEAVRTERARAARQLVEAQTAKELQRELTAADRKKLRDAERQQLNRDMDADFKFISTPFDFNAEIERLEQLNRRRRTSDQIPIPSMNRLRAAVASQRIEALARAARFLIEKDSKDGTETTLERKALAILRHPSVTREELSSTYNRISQVEARFVQVAMEQKYGATMAEAMQASRADGINSLAGDAIDTNILGAPNLEAALKAVQQNGTPFQKILAARLAPVLRGVRLVVVNDAISDVRDPVALAEFAGENKPAGLFYRDTIYLNNTDGANGVNPVILLHEAFHAATVNRIGNYLNNPNAAPENVKQAMKQLIDLMQLAASTYQSRKKAGVTSAEENSLFEVGAFTDPKEFSAYGVTQPEMETFLAGLPGIYGTEEQARNENMFTRFIKILRRLFNLPPSQQSALEQLIAVTDQLIDGPKVVTTPAQQAAAARKIKKEADMVRRVNRSRTYDQLNKDVFTLLRNTRSIKDARNVVSAAFKAMSAKTLRAALKVMDTDNILRLGKSKGIDNIEEIGVVMQRLAGMRGQLIKVLAKEVDIWEDFNSKSPEGAADLADIMNLSTIVQVNPLLANDAASYEAQDAELKGLESDLTKMQADPATSPRAISTQKLRIKRRKEYIAEVYTLWDRLGKYKNGKGRQIYKMALEGYEKSFQMHIDLLIAAIRKSGLEGDENDPTTPKGKLMASIVKRFQEAKKQYTVYFPLMRFGEYWLSVGKGKNKEAVLFESESVRNYAMQTRYEELRAAGEQRTLEQMIADGDIRVGMNNQDLKSELLDPSEGSAILRDIFTMLENGQMSDIEAVKDQVYQMFLMTLPDQDIRRRFLKRKARTGFTTDVLRSYITAQQTAANQLSRLKYGPEVRAALGASYDILQGDPEAEKLTVIMDELARRTTSELTPPPPNEDGLNFDRFARYGNQAVFFYMLSSLKSALIQATQFPIVTMPTLVSEYGLTKTLALTAKYMNSFNKLGVAVENPDGNIVTKWGPLTTYESSYVRSRPELRRAWEDGQAADTFGATYSADITARRRAPSYKYAGPLSKGTRAAFNLMSGAFHHIERLTREHTHLIAFELEYEKQLKAGLNADAAFEAASKKAIALTNETLFNFQNYNKPPIMKEGLGRLAFQFMTYPMQMTYFLGRNFYGMLPLLGNEEKKAAATKFFGVVGVTYMFAGATGLPFYAMMMGFMDGMKELFGFDGDDDDITDPRNPAISSDIWFRRIFLPSLFGPNSGIADALGLSKEQAEVLARAAEVGPISALTDLNFNTSTTLGDLWYPQSLPSDTSRDALQAFFYEYALGPFGSMAVGIADGYNLLMEGETMRGIEKLAPAFLRGEIKRQRILAEGGEYTPTGNLVKEGEFFTMGKLFAQSIGFGSTEISQVQTFNRLAKGQEREILKLRKGIYDDFDKAITKYNNKPTDENFARIGDATEELIKYNLKYSMWPIEAADVEKSLIGRAKSRAQAQNGLVINPNLLPYFQDLMPE